MLEVVALLGQVLTGRRQPEQGLLVLTVIPEKFKEQLPAGSLVVGFDGSNSLLE